MFLLGKDQNIFISSKILLEIIEFFKYSKNNNRYWKEKYLLKLIKSKMFFIKKYISLFGSKNNNFHQKKLIPFNQTAKYKIHYATLLLLVLLILVIM